MVATAKPTATDVPGSTLSSAFAFAVNRSRRSSRALLTRRRPENTCGAAAARARHTIATTRHLGDGGAVYEHQRRLRGRKNTRLFNFPDGHIQHLPSPKLLHVTLTKSGTTHVSGNDASSSTWLLINGANARIWAATSDNSAASTSRTPLGPIRLAICCSCNASNDDGRDTRLKFGASIKLT